MLKQYSLLLLVAVCLLPCLHLWGLSQQGLSQLTEVYTAHSQNSFALFLVLLGPNSLIALTVMNVLAIVSFCFLLNQLLKVIFQSQLDLGGILAASSVLAVFMVLQSVTPVVLIVDFVLLYGLALYGWLQRGQKRPAWLKAAYLELFLMGLSLGVLCWLWPFWGPLVCLGMTGAFLGIRYSWAVPVWLSPILLAGLILGASGLVLVWPGWPQLGFNGLNTFAQFFWTFLPIGVLFVPLFLEKDLWVMLVRRYFSGFLFLMILLGLSLLLSIFSAHPTDQTIFITLAQLAVSLLFWQLLLLSRHSKVASQTRLTQYILILFSLLAIVLLLMIGLELVQPQWRFWIPVLATLAIIFVVVMGLTTSLPLIQWFGRVVAPLCVGFLIITHFVNQLCFQPNVLEPLLSIQPSINSEKAVVIDCIHPKQMAQALAKIQDKVQLLACSKGGLHIKPNTYYWLTEKQVANLPEQAKSQLIPIKAQAFWQQSIGPVRLLKASKMESYGYESLIENSVLFYASDSKITQEQVIPLIESLELEN